jgi:hypothetical protein
MARKINNRQINITYLILVEGSTELIYFQNLKESQGRFGFTVKLRKAKHGSPVPLIEEALKEYKGGVYRNIWCVYDCDVLFLSERGRGYSGFKKAYPVLQQKSGLAGKKSLWVLKRLYGTGFGKCFESSTNQSQCSNYGNINT